MTTVVGVPGRIVKQADSDAKQRQRHAIAEKMGFDAYGTSADMPDPVAHAINCMLDHIHAMDSKMEGMCGAIKELGAEIGDLYLPELESCEIRSSEEDNLSREKLETGTESVENKLD
jgi:serine O-acetyltransferase